MLQGAVKCIFTSESFDVMKAGTLHCYRSIEVELNELTTLTPANTAGLHFRAGDPKRLLFVLKNANERYQIYMGLKEFFFIPFWGSGRYGDEIRA